jgi:hypothetical protein
MQHIALIRPILILALLSGAVAQKRTSTSIDVEGGKITIDFTTTKIGDRSPTDLPVGTVWRMSKDAAAGLTTTVPLITRKLMLMPGTYGLSARRVSKSKGELVIFQGGMLFQDGMKHDTSSLRLDEEAESVEKLTISLKKSKRSSGEQARIKLMWGKHSLNTRFTVLGSTNVDGTLGGKPAKFSFFHLPVSSYQAKLRNGDLLPVGLAQQKGEDGVAYSIHAQKEGTNGVNLIFKNETLAMNPVSIKANRDMQKRVNDFMSQASDAQATQLKERLIRMAAELKQLEKQQKTASALSKNVTFTGEVVNASSTSKNLKVVAENGEAGISVAMTFGAKVANFVVKDSSFKKQQ